MKFRSPISRARGLGSSKDGFSHWWMQRLTAIALVPLVLWFVISIISVSGADRAQVLIWLASPHHGILLSIFIITLLYHANLGMQMIYRDYIEARWLQLGARILTGFLAVLLGSTAIFSLLRLILGS